MDNISKAINQIKNNHPHIDIKSNEPMRNHTTFKIGGEVRLMIFPETTDGLTDIYDILYTNNITPFILGNGSNILVSDDFHDLVVISTSKLCAVSLLETDDTEYGDINAEAGVLLSNLAVFVYEKGLTGFEFAHGIPGTLGGAVVMNAGAYGGEMKDVVINTVAYNKDKGIHRLTATDNDFSYRKSRFTSTGDLVLSSTLRLKYGDKQSIKQKIDELSKRRRESQPLDLPSGGSTFKRPKEGYAAALIEQAGLKGYTAGGAQVSERHSGFIVNKGNATFSDVMAVIDHVQETVFKQSGIELESEIKIIY